MGTLNKNTIEKCEMIKSAVYKHIEVYECQLKINNDFQKFVKNYNKEIVEPLSPQNAFYSGRTNATKLLYNFKENECGRYVDFCSLYPTEQYYKKNTLHVTRQKYSTLKSKLFSPVSLALI